MQAFCEKSAKSLSKITGFLINKISCKLFAKNQQKALKPLAFL